MSDPRGISIIVPAMNEATHLRMVLPRLPQVHEVILVDGGSSDDTVSVAHLVRARDHRLHPVPPWQGQCAGHRFHAGHR